MEKINPWIDQNEQKHSAVRGFGLILVPASEPTNITINNQEALAQCCDFKYLGSSWSPTLLL